jgi:helix-turn-helix protein
MASIAREMWVRFETYHDVTYFTPESRAATDAVGCKGGWMGYFGMRAAPLGAASPALVTATFYNFHPGKVARAIPDAWEVASPERFLEIRLSGVDGALRRMLPAEVLSGAELTEAAGLMRQAAESAPIAGRPLGAANAALDWPAEPHLMMWHAATRLRESRGDGHVAALVSAGLDPCETLVMFGADNGLTADYLQLARGWSPDEWALARNRLVARGLLTEEGQLTAEGTAARRWVEERTDAEAEAPWLALGGDACARLAELLNPISLYIAKSNAQMEVNPLGLAPVDELSRLAAERAG